MILEITALIKTVHHTDICKIAKLQIRRCNHPILGARNIGGYLANLCNSTVIEMYGDIIRVSHAFEGCQMLEYIADSNTSALKTGNDDITNILRTLIFPTLLELSGFVKAAISCRDSVPLLSQSA